MATGKGGTAGAAPGVVVVVGVGCLWQHPQHMWPVPHEMDCNGLGCSALLWLQISATESGSVFSSLQSPVWGLFLFLFRQHRRQHCYCLLMHYFALFSCGRQQQQVAAAAQADGVARAWQWASVQHTNLFFFAVCGELKIHKFPTATAAR